MTDYNKICQILIRLMKIINDLLELYEKDKEPYHIIGAKNISKLASEICNQYFNTGQKINSMDEENGGIDFPDLIGENPSLKGTYIPKD